MIRLGKVGGGRLIVMALVIDVANSLIDDACDGNGHSLT